MRVLLVEHESEEAQHTLIEHGLRISYDQRSLSNLSSISSTRIFLPCTPPTTFISSNAMRVPSRNP